LQAYSGKKPPSPDMNDILQVVPAPVGDHSAKPAEIRQRIIELYPDEPRLEMFARNEWEGWEVFGNQVANAVPQPASVIQGASMMTVVPPNASGSWWHKKKIWTTAEAAEYLGVSTHRVIDYIRPNEDGKSRLDARKSGRQWAISKRSVMNFKKKPRDLKGGRPRKK